ncbi:MAG: radical SAM protein [Thermanaeromonas sp.]|uniref:radical SAM protein n=1 Tax=Thermanaeromonas sp. TaxID=2003697 RepID=UPI0024407DBF|nr:radical SAM protein [Thermanaeromonas sp.]MCG0277439.1 radical SAM protein [Thermanaeromonas sp.]
MVLPSNWQEAKKLVAERTLEEVFKYIERNPEENFPRLLSIARLIARKEEHKQQIQGVLKAYQENPAIRAYVNRLFTELHPNIKKRMVYNWFVNAMLLGIPRQQQVEEETGIHIPNFFLLDPTSACNLRCYGCWAGEYAKHDTLEFELVDRLCREAKEVGIYWLVMSGGEPFLWPHLFELARRHQDMAFMLYTNGTLIDDDVADRIIEVGNISPAISLEGWRERTDARRGRGVFDRVVAAMDRLRKRGAVFGASITITRENVEEVTSDEFVDFLIEKGVAYVWTFHFIPVGRDPDLSLVITPEQRAYLAERIPYLRTHKPIQIADFWNDGELTGGCIAGGRRYFHITARGDVEPCAFVHFAVDNIKEKTLKEVLASPLFRAYQRRQPFSRNLLRPCPIIDVPEALREIVAETGARPTHPGAEKVLDGSIGSFLDMNSKRWAEVADSIWLKRHPEDRSKDFTAAK